MNKTDSYHVKTIWDYMKLHHEMKKMDAILILGSNDLRVAGRAAELYHEGLGEYIICSGGNGKNSVFKKTEAEMFFDELIMLGVPNEKILLEKRATNTGENIIYSRKMIEEKGYNFSSFILVQKPYMERRIYATFKKNWMKPEIIVTSPNLSFEDLTGAPKFKKHFNTIVGELQRVREYPKLGFSIEQEIPGKVLDAWKILVGRGYKKYYIDDFDLVSFKLSEDLQDIVERVYKEESKIIHGLLGDIEIHHVGGTSIPKLLTKGDLDVNIRVSQGDFKKTVDKLREHYFTAQISNWNDTFASFKDYRLEIDFGIQVTVIDSSGDHFLKHKSVLLGNPKKIEDFNKLKLDFEGKEMRYYRKAKAEFLRSM